MRCACLRGSSHRLPLLFTLSWFAFSMTAAVPGPFQQDRSSAAAVRPSSSSEERGSLAREDLVERPGVQDTRGPPVPLHGFGLAHAPPDARRQWSETHREHFEEHSRLALGLRLLPYFLGILTERTHQDF